MMYQVTESEQYQIEKIHGQMRMVATLAAQSKGQLSQLLADDLAAFLDTQCELLSTLLESMDQRYETEREAEQMAPTDWVHLIRIVAGKPAFSPQGSEASVRQRLQASAQVNSDYLLVLDEYLQALQAQSVNPHPVTRAPAKQPAKRKRDKLTAKTVEVA